MSDVPFSPFLPFFFPYGYIVSGITVHAAQQEVHAEIGHQHRCKGQGKINVQEQRPSKGGKRTVVHRKTIDQQCDECPRLFRVLSL